MVNYYEILGLDRELEGDILDSELTKIQRTWQSRTNAPSLEKRQEAETLLKIAIEAKEILTNPEARKKYDKQFYKEEIVDEEAIDNVEETADIDKVDNLDDLIKQIEDQVGQNNISSALLLAKEVSIQAPNNQKVISYLVYCYWRMGQFEDAKREYEAARELNLNLSGYYRNLISTYLNNGNYNAAESYLKMIREMEPDSKIFFRLETFLLNKKGQYIETITMIEKIMEHNELDRSKEVDLRILYDYAEAKSAEALSYYDESSNGNYYFTDLDKLDRAKELWQETEKYKFVYKNPDHIEERIEYLDSLYKKKFKDGGGKLFIIPLIITILGFIGESIGIFVVGLVLVAGITYFVHEPQWKIDRNRIIGKKTPVDHAIFINDGILTLGGVVIGLGIAIFAGLFSIFVGLIFSSNDDY